MPRPHEKLITLRGTHMGESAKAVKFSVTHVSGSKLAQETIQWLPFSQVTSIMRDTAGDELTVSEWICQQKELFDKEISTETGAWKPEPAQKSETHLSGGHFDSYDDDDIPF